MTPSQLSAIRARLSLAHIRTDDNYLPDLRALLDEVERLKNDLAMARQVSGELCEACGWAMKFPGEPCRCEMVKWCDEWEAFKARMTEQDASSFRRGAEAMQDELAGWADRAYAKALTSDDIRMLPHASSEPDLDLTGDRAFDAIQPSLGTPVPPERRICRQADVDAAFARGAEAMRTAAVEVASRRANLQRLTDSDMAWGRSAECILDELRNLPAPEDK
jgi:hypothetical protein